MGSRRMILLKKTRFLAIAAVFAITFFCACTSKKEVKSIEQNIPQRIISLSPSQTEILCAIGAFNQLVARSQFCDFPPQVLELPVAGGFDGKTISLETLLLYEPDLVLLSKGMHDFLLEPLKSRGIKTFVSQADSVNSILNEINKIADLTGRKEQGKILSSQIKEGLLQVMQRTSEKGAEPISVYWDVYDSPYMSIGNQSFINELITIAGGTNIFSTINQPYPIVSEEAIIQSNPQVIIVAKTAVNNISSIESRLGWKNISAVKNKRVYALDQDLISRPGPRIVQAAEQISDVLYKNE